MKVIIYYINQLRIDMEKKKNWWPVIWTIIRYVVTAIAGYITGDQVF